MASSIANTMREEVTCPICLELMAKPVFIGCGHIYCHSCILENLEKQQQKSPSQGKFLCPVCRVKFQRESIWPFKQLENIINNIKKLEQELQCEKHREKLWLYCYDDVQLICWRCERSPQHNGHTTVPAEDASKCYKEIYQRNLAYFRKQEERNKEWKSNIIDQKEKFQDDFQQEEERIKLSFKLYHMILHMQEKSYLWRLENKKEQVLKRLQDSEAQLEKQSQELNKLMLELERKCQGSVQEILKDAKDTLDRISSMQLNAPEDVSLEIHTMLDDDRIVRELIKLFETDYANVTLDPDTAHSDLLVEMNKIMVTGGRPQVKPDTPARFKDLPCVLGCETFTSGKNFLGKFEITGSLWDVGVCLENVPRDNDKTRVPETGFWAIRHCEDDNYVALTSPLTPLNMQQPLYCIGVFLDYEAGRVSFYDLGTSSHIFTFPKASFPEPVRPYFCISGGSCIFIH